MPATLEIDREAVKVLVMELGCREAARRMGLNENTVMAWSRRFGWLETRPANVPLPPSVIQPARNARTASEALADAYKDDRVQTRLAMSRATRKAATALEQKDGNSLLSDGGTTLKTVAQAASLVHGWQEQSQARVVVCLQALEQSQGAELSVSPIDTNADYDPEMDASNY